MAKIKPKPAVDEEQLNSESEKSSGKGRKILIIFSILFLLLILGGGGFAAGVYFKLINLPQIAQQLKLYDIPYVGPVIEQYLPRPEPEPEPVNPQSEQPVAQKQPETPPAPTVAPPATPPLAPPVIDEKEKLAREAQAAKEQNKRVSKLARLYGEMKPDEAVPILNLLDDETVLVIFSKMEEDQVSKIMVLFNPDRSARLSQSMLKGSKPYSSL